MPLARKPYSFMPLTGKPKAAMNTILMNTILRNSSAQKCLHAWKIVEMFMEARRNVPILIMEARRNVHGSLQKCSHS